MLKNCLIAGPTNSGKTILSQRLVKEHGFSRLPGDALVLAFQKSFPDLGIGHEIEGMDDEAAYESTLRQFGGFVVQLAEALAWENPRPYVLDSFHIFPEHLTGLDSNKTQVVSLGYPEADPMEKAKATQQYQAATCGRPFGWVSSDIATVAERFAIFTEMSQRLRDQCESLGFPFFDTGCHFTEALLAAENLAVSGDKTYDQ